METRVEEGKEKLPASVPSYAFVQHGARAHSLGSLEVPQENRHTLVQLSDGVSDVVLSETNPLI